MLPETLVTLIWTLDQSGSFSWAAADAAKRAEARRGNCARRILSALRKGGKILTLAPCTVNYDVRKDCAATGPDPEGGRYNGTTIRPRKRRLQPAEIR